MILITEHIATFEIDGEETVVFKRAHEVYGVYGKNIVATLIKDGKDGDQGVYNTSDGGKVIIAHYSDKKELYLKGSGTVIVWCGASPLDDPFSGVGSGGGEKAVITGDFGLLGEVNDEVIVGDVVVNPLPDGMYQALRTNYANTAIPLKNWAAKNNDDFELIFRICDDPAAKIKWPALLYGLSERYWIALNFYGYRKALSVHWNETSSTERYVEYDSPYDYEHIYSVKKDGEIFTINKYDTYGGTSTIVGTTTITGISTDTAIDEVLYISSTQYVADFEFYELKVTNASGTLIHDYKPCVQNQIGGILDVVTNTFINAHDNVGFTWVNNMYEPAEDYYTDFVISGYSTGGMAINDVAAVKIVTTDAIPVGTSVELYSPDGTQQTYSFGQAVSQGKIIWCIDDRLADIISAPQWQMRVITSAGQPWQAPPMIFTLMKEVNDNERNYMDTE